MAEFRELSKASISGLGGKLSPGMKGVEPKAGLPAIMPARPGIGTAFGGPENPTTSGTGAGAKLLTGPKLGLGTRAELGRIAKRLGLGAVTGPFRGARPGLPPKKEAGEGPLAGPGCGVRPSKAAGLRGLGALALTGIEALGTKALGAGIEALGTGASVGSGKALAGTGAGPVKDRDNTLAAVLG